MRKNSILRHIGERFGRYTVLAFDHKDKYKNNYFLCKCDCGKERIVRLTNLQTGEIKSCGCYKIDGTRERLEKHGMSDSRLYREWACIKARCKEECNSRWKDYGGRGIIVCDEWDGSFEKFRDWALNNGYDDGLTIDRIDVNGDYTPSNCRWITNKEQQRNRRNNKTVVYKGECQTLIELCEKYDANYHLVESRLLRGWDIEKAVETPKRVFSYYSSKPLLERSYAFNGEVKPLKEWANTFGISHNRIHYYIKNMGMTLEEIAMKQEKPQQCLTN